jgi:hypothetical protein
VCSNPPSLHRACAAAPEKAAPARSKGESSVSTIDLTAIPLPTSDQSDSLLRIRHSCAHIMAMAMQRVHRGTLVTIGPWIEQGFYYDFDVSAVEEQFTDKVLKKVQKEMRRIIRKNLPFVKEEVSADEARRRIASLGESYKLEILDRIVERCAGPVSSSHSLFGIVRDLENSSSDAAYTLEAIVHERVSSLCCPSAEHQHLATDFLARQNGVFSLRAQGRRCTHHHLPHWAARREGALVGPVCRAPCRVNRQDQSAGI